MSMPNRMARRLEKAEGLDRVAKPISSVVKGIVRPRVIRNGLSGTNLGHPLHPPLTDVPIGAWTMAGVLDATGKSEMEPAADMLVMTGMIAAVPTALSGANDWADTLGEERRVGLVHAFANSAALLLYGASLAARVRGHRGKGKALGFAGLGLMAAGGYLGGHLSFVRGVNVNRTAWLEGPEEWTPVLADAELAEGAHRTADADGVRVLLHRSAGKVYAIAATCSHLGGPLGEGTIEDGCVQCPWHGSTFRFTDGGIERGPASSPQPCYETRSLNGRIEIRVPPETDPLETAEEQARTLTGTR